MVEESQGGASGEAQRKMRLEDMGMAECRGQPALGPGPGESCPLSHCYLAHLALC